MAGLCLFDLLAGQFYLNLSAYRTIYTGGTERVDPMVQAFTISISKRDVITV